MEGRALRRARLVAIALVLAVIGLELGLYHLGGYGRNPATISDEELGYRTLPDQAVRALDGTLFRINDDGYRDRDWDRADASSSADDRPLRIALLGDSVTYGYHVPVESTWGRRLEQRARALRDVDVLTMNFAQPGYVFEQLARTWEVDAQPHRPDLVILAVNAHSAQPAQSFPVARDFPLRSMVLKSAIYDYLARGVFEQRGFLQFEDPGPPEPGTDRARDRALRAAIAADPYAPEHDPAWNAMRTRCEELIADCRAHGARVVVVCIPQLGDVLGEQDDWCGDRWAAWAADGLDCVVLDALPDFRDALAPILDELSDASVAPRELWTRRADPALVQRFAGSGQNLYLFHDPNHLSPAGHDRLATWLAGELSLEVAQSR